VREVTAGSDCVLPTKAYDRIASARPDTSPKLGPKEFLRACRELKIPQFIAACADNVHIVAPREIIDSARDVSPTHKFVDSHEWESLAHEPTDILVFDYSPGVPSAALRERFPRSNIHVINFDLVLRLACGKRKLNEWQSLPELSYCILCTPRSGSTLLANLLTQSGLGHPLEHIRLPVVALINSGGYTFEAVMETLRRIATRNGVFGTKLISEFMLKIFGYGGAPLLGDFLAERGFKVVRLHRNLCEQVVSWYSTSLTKVWHLRGQAEIKGVNIPYDFQALSQLHDRFTKEEKFVEKVLARIPAERVVNVAFADLSGDPVKSTKRLANLIKPDLPDKPVALQRAPRKISAEIGQMNEIVRRFEAELVSQERSMAQILHS
jgi:LPS sulfotransferase NodH